MHSWLLNYSSFFDDIQEKTIYVRTTYHIATFYTRFISVSRSQVRSWKQKLREYLFLFDGINLYVSKLAKAKKLRVMKPVKFKLLKLVPKGLLLRGILKIVIKTHPVFS